MFTYLFDQLLDVGQRNGYVYQVEQYYLPPYADQGDSDALCCCSNYDLPWFPNRADAVNWFDNVAAFPGEVLRMVRDLQTGGPSWVTAGVTYVKRNGERDYWKGRNATPGIPHYWEIPRRTWEELAPEAKSLIHGQPHLLTSITNAGTCLVPVHIYQRRIGW